MTEISAEEDIAQTMLKIIREQKPQTAAELIDLVKAEVQSSKKRITKTLIKLQDEGKIALFDQPMPATLKLGAYPKTSHTLWFWLTVTITIATVIVIFTIPENLYPWVYTRNILGAMFVLWLPGYTLIKTLFPSKKELDPIERIALSIGLSLALVPIVGLLLNYTPWGIRLTPITLSLLALTITFATIALVREHQTITSKNVEQPKRQSQPSHTKSGLQHLNRLHFELDGYLSTTLQRSPLRRSWPKRARGTSTISAVAAPSFPASSALCEGP